MWPRALRASTILVLCVGETRQQTSSLIRFGGEPLVAHPVEFGSGQDQTAGRPQADLPRHGLGRVPVVAGHHDRLQTGPDGHLDRLHHLRPRRIDHAEQADEGQILFNLIRVGVFGNGIQGAVCHGEHPEGVAGHFPVPFVNLPTHVFRQRNGLPVLKNTVAEVQNDVRRPLDEGEDGRIRESRRCTRPGGGRVMPVDRGHPFPVRIKGDLRHPRQDL